MEERRTERDRASKRMQLKASIYHCAQEHTASQLTYTNTSKLPTINFLTAII